MYKVVIFFVFGWLHCFYYVASTKSNNSKRNIEDDYMNYVNYDYDPIPNKTKTFYNNDLFILPTPDLSNKVDVLPEIELPDNSLADPDLKDHDKIDNLMYVYYGSHIKHPVSYTSKIVVFGAILSIIAQVFVVFGILKDKNGATKDVRCIFLHMMGAFFLSNWFLIVLGFYKMKTHMTCLILSTILYYFHLLTAVFIFCYCLYVYDNIFNIGLVKEKKFFATLGYALTLLYSMISFIVNSDSFESRKYCFLSIEKGMLFNYMIPVGSLLIITTTICLKGIRKLNTELQKLEFSDSFESLNILKAEVDCLIKGNSSPNYEIVNLLESKSCLRLLCLIQMLYVLDWFILVIAIENNSIVMSVAYAFLVTFLHWSLYFKLRILFPVNISTQKVLEEVCTYKEKEMKEFPKKEDSLDNLDCIPLLVNAEQCAAAEVQELFTEPISTISY